MLKNYLKIAIAVLLRRKFLTFVNLFGTVLTLTVLVVAFAIYESFVHPGGAQHRYDRILAIDSVSLLKLGQNHWIGGPGGMFFTQYVKPLRTPDLVSLVTQPGTGTSYVDGRKLTMQVRSTDAAYWQILDFGLRAGRVLAPDDIDTGRSVAVINEATADAWFPGQAAVGRSIVIDSHSYEVVGVVRNEPETSRLSYADVWVPLTSAATRAYEQEWMSGNQILLYVNDPAKRAAVREELAARVKRFEVNPDPVRYNTLRAYATTPIEDMALRARTAAKTPGPGDDPQAGHYVAGFLAAATVVALLFMALPAVNMINLNVGRMMERAPEIGLRKAAGAPTRALVGQFIFENLVLATLGGLISLATAPLILGIVNGVLRYGQLRLSVPVLVAGLIFVAIFGVLSGAYPAWKMARLDPAAALKGQRYV
jgi:putative ABC transport system permease protein